MRTLPLSLELPPPLLLETLTEAMIINTVKIMTVHKAKGLEFPVVMCPILWTSADRIQGTMVHAHVATGDGGHRLIDTGWVYGSATASITKNNGSSDLNRVLPRMDFPFSTVSPDWIV